MDRPNEIVQDFFNVLTQVRRTKGAHLAPEMVHGRMSSFLEKSMRRADDLGLNQADVRDIGYVLAALADEVMLSMDVALREYWLPRVLQLQYFNENTAGEGVFQRIDALLAEPNRAEVLQIYYYALLFGFQGKYRIRNGAAQLATVTERIADSLERSGVRREAELAPSAGRPTETSTRLRRRLPLIAISLGVLLLAVGTYIGLRIHVGGATTDLVERIGAESD